MLLKSWWVKASRVMPVRRDMVAAKSMRARLPGVLRHQHGEVIALSKDMSIAGILTHSDTGNNNLGAIWQNCVRSINGMGLLRCVGVPSLGDFFLTV